MIETVSIESFSLGKSCEHFCGSCQPGSQALRVAIQCLPAHVRQAQPPQSWYDHTRGHWGRASLPAALGAKKTADLATLGVGLLSHQQPLAGTETDPGEAG